MGGHAMYRRIQTLCQTIVFILVLCSTPAALALEIYAGAEGTATTLGGGCDSATVTRSFSGSCDDKSSGYKAFAGLQLIPLTALEVCYIDFGKATVSGSLGGVPTSREFSGSAEYLAFVLRATFFDRLTVFGKAGADYWHANGDLGQSLAASSQSATGTGFMYGVGASFRLIGPLGVILE